MARLHFASRLRHVAPPGTTHVSASTLREALDGVFAHHAALRSYVVDEQARLRKHVAIFVDGRRIDASELDIVIGADADIYVMQALSGG
ncbi:MAG TPA: MoaD/ThiS family protein [Micropepsaceae bacterium]|nr:MoaD/ThiS family protein [Micropepsaceae bacterium]